MHHINHQSYLTSTHCVGCVSEVVYLLLSNAIFKILKTFASKQLDKQEGTPPAKLGTFLTHVAVSRGEIFDVTLADMFNARRGRRCTIFKSQKIKANSCLLKRPVFHLTCHLRGCHGKVELSCKIVSLTWSGGLWHTPLEKVKMNKLVVVLTKRTGSLVVC